MPSARAAALLAEIHAHPDDDGLRLVYADVLVEEGDPRGEFIQLQLRPALQAAQRKRMDELLVAHRQEWLGGLSSGLHVEACRFERGFLAVARLRGWGEIPSAIVGDPTWCTVRAIEPYMNSNWLGIARRLVTDPRLRALEDVQLLPEDDFLAMCRGEGSSRLTSLGVRGPWSDRDPFAPALARVHVGFPRLRRIMLNAFVPRGADGLVDPDPEAQPRWFAPLLDVVPPSIERAGVSCGVEHLATWMRALEKTRFLVFDLETFGGQVRFTVHRPSTAHAFRDVELRLPSTWPKVAMLTSHVQIALLTVPVDAFDRLSVVLSDGGSLAPARRKLVEAAMARFEGAEKVMPRPGKPTKS